MNQIATRLLMVEDDPEISRLVSEFMTREGFEMHLAENGVEMDALLTRLRPDLVILDLMLPGEDGLSICRRLRLADTIPIIMLTAKSDEVDRVVGLEMGADDYLVKPFGARELLARVRAVLRRGQASVAPRANRRLSFEGFVLDLDARGLEIAESGEPIQLTTAEFDLLACFAQHPRRVLTRDQIMDFTRGRNFDPFDRTIDMLVSRLRRKLSAVIPDVNLISTVRNGGYLMTVPVKQVL
ncbi:response regulator [Jiella endophytica]|uniref:Regulatory protein VirG n=1 Tax=Jiella endophytica TaxID=2558362 RepID=A0A4Y8RH98_9HYPH|nr:response regulator [Jiella endophytica]TFF22122.1 response regulator [Jiella endophytica]